MTVPAFLSVSGTPITTSGTLAVTLSGTALPIANGGTAVTSVTTSPTATAFAGWDSNKNLSANNHIEGYATTATAAGTTTLTVSSTYLQYFTGTTTQTVQLPVTSTLVLGQQFLIENRSTGVVTVQTSGSNTIKAMEANSQLLVTCILITGTTAASWDYSYSVVQGALPVGDGGTGEASFTAYSVICGGTSSTGALQNVSGVGTSGQVLTSNGASALPTWQAVSSSPTSNYFAGYQTISTHWNTTSSSYGNFSATGTSALTSRTSNGLTVTVAGSNLPGIVFTPASSSAIYQITCSYTSYNTGNNNNSFRLYDGTNVIVTGTSYGTPTVRMTLHGIYAPGTTSSVTVNLQGATSGGTLQIDNEGVSGLSDPAMEWTLMQIK
jgi:hypothetical protein